MRISDLPVHLFTPPPDCPPDVNFRPVQADDLLTLHEVCYPERPLTRFRQNFPGRLRRQEQGRGLWLVAEWESVGIVGGGQLILFGERGEIADLSVVAPYRSRGIGSAMITILTAVAHFRGLNILEIGVDSNNWRALALYQRLGFVEDRRRRIPNGGTAIILMKTFTVE